jgi:hypothetical protein
VERDLLTLTGAPNRILRLRDDQAVVATTRSQQGQDVPIADVQRALDGLAARGELVVGVDSVGYRSAFIGAVLRELPVVRVEGMRISLDPDLLRHEQRAPLEPGTTYTWEELGPRFGFKPAYLGAAGGMPVSTAANAVLVITHPGGGKSFDYQDYWDGPDLIYTGRGKIGDQLRTGANLDVAENRRRLFAFEAAGPKRLRYLGQPTCVEERIGRAPGGDDVERDVFLFRLRFDDGEGRDWASPDEPAEPQPGRHRDPPHRRSRPFDPSDPAPPRIPEQSARPEEIQAKSEKAVLGHARILNLLSSALESSNWTAIEEIPGAIDLWAVAPNQQRVIFEAKTITESNELDRCRGGLAQLLEYRLEYGEGDDVLCLAVDQPLSVRRARLLSRLGAAVVRVDEDGVHAVNDAGTAIARLTRDGNPARLTPA